MKRILLAAFVWAVAAAGASAASVEEDVQRYVQIAAGEKNRGHMEAIEALGWMGLSDSRVFDVLERRLLSDQAGALLGDRMEQQRIAWYIRALGFSGQPKYEETLRAQLSNRAYSGYAKTALQELPQYQRWNPVISNRATFDPQYSDDVNRLLNMLRSDDLQLKRLAAKRIYFRNQDGVLLDVLAEQLEGSYASGGFGSSDAVAWMVKALGQAWREKDRPLLERVSVEARDTTVRNYAKKALSRR